jgi:hypothetical protein
MIKKDFEGGKPPFIRNRYNKAALILFVIVILFAMTVLFQMVFLDKQKIIYRCAYSGDEMICKTE